MKEYEFRIVVAASLDEYDRLEERLLGMGVEDGYLGATDTVVFVDFAREAESMTEAVLSAIRAVRSAEFNVERVDADDQVTLAEIARRTGRTRESIRLLALGDRGHGNFPPPIGKQMRSKHWRWSDVAPWLEKAGMIESGQAEEARAIAAINGALELVRNTDSDKRRHAIVEAVQA